MASEPECLDRVTINCTDGPHAVTRAILSILPRSIPRSRILCLLRALEGLSTSSSDELLFDLKEAWIAAQQPR